MTAAAAVALAAALVLWVPPGAGHRDRLRAVVPATGAGPSRRPAPSPPPGKVRRWAESAAAAVAVFLVLGGGVGAVLTGAAVAVGLERVLRRAGAEPDRAARLAADLPVACDLLAVCLAAGTPVGAALAAVGGSVSGPLAERLVEIGALYRLGAAPRRAWSEATPPLDALGRTVVRAGESGSAVVPALQRLAADLRSSDRSATAAAVQRAGVWVLAPLGLCFLPAFLCLGVVPLVLGIAGDVFG